MSIQNISEKLKIVQNPCRPNAIEYISAIFPDFIEVHGDRLFGDDPSIIGGLAALNGSPLTIIGQIRGRNLQENLKYNFSMSHPEGFRKSLRLMKQAEKFHRPIVCFIDTLGAYPGVEAETRGQSAAIANNIMEMMMLKVPIFSIFIGNGVSGGALALSVANETVMLEHSLFSVMSPKGCALVLWKDASRHMEAAESLKMTAEDIYRMGLADIVLKEPEGGAHTDMAFMASKIEETIGDLIKKYRFFNASKTQRSR
jgi:acetyl-CoA carboxylase carboxyl transferase subunit alpha